jgi:hypothetical protein
MQRAPRISRAQAVAIPPAASSEASDWVIAAVALALLALALLAP